MRLDTAPAVHALIDCVEPLILLRRAAAARSRGNDWGLLITPADRLAVLEGDLVEVEKEAAAFASDVGVYLGVHPTVALRRVLTQAKLGDVAGELAKLDADLPRGHVRLVGLVPDEAHVTSLRADPEYVERFVALERRVRELSAEALPAIEMLEKQIPPPPYDEPLALVVLCADEPAVTRLRLLRRGAYASAERPPLMGTSSGIYVGVHAADEVIEGLKLRDLDNPAAPQACAFLTLDGAHVRAIVSVEDHFLLVDHMLASEPEP